ncbi:MAG: SCO family protein [Hyphomicrobiales bacterium]
MSGQASTTHRIAIASLLLLAAAAIGTYAWMSSSSYQKSFGEALVGGPFTMTNQSGETVTEKTYAGKPMLLFFGYTYCPDVCPTELQVMAEALRQLGSKGADIQPVFVSIDPARDTPEQLKTRMRQFRPAVHRPHRNTGAGGGHRQSLPCLLQKGGERGRRRCLSDGPLLHHLSHGAGRQVPETLHLFD